MNIGRMNDISHYCNEHTTPISSRKMNIYQPKEIYTWMSTKE